MDEDRKIRFLVAPTLFIASMVFGALLDPAHPNLITYAINSSSLSKLVGLIAAGGLLVFVSGYVIGTFTYFILRLLFQFRPLSWGKSRFHEVAPSDDALVQIWRILGAPGTPNRLQELSAGGAFDHGYLRKNYEGVHRWIFRRWNAFSIAVTSICWLGLSIPFGVIMLQVPLTWGWVISVAIFSLILSFVMTWAWRDAMSMAEFMANLPTIKNASGETTKNP